MADYKLGIIKRFTLLFGIPAAVPILIILFPLPGLVGIDPLAFVNGGSIIKSVQETLQWLQTLQCPHNVILHTTQLVTAYCGAGGNDPVGEGNDSLPI